MNQYPKIPNALVRPILNSLGENEIILQKTVNETLFGYEDPALKKLSEMTLVSKFVKIEPIFGLLAGQNGTTNPGNILVDLGQENFNLANEILLINGKDKVNYWNSDYANDIAGTDGQQMHPFIKRNENVTSYCTDIFRSIWMTYTHDDNIYGVTTFHYELPPEVFALPDSYAPNQGFCVEGKTDLNKPGIYPCPPGAGVLNISPAEPMNAPVYISQPHFLHADSLYRDAYTGLSEPNKTIHGTWARLEPITGFIFGAAKRVQYNFLMKRSNLVPEMNKLPKSTHLPVFWYEITVDVDRFSAYKWRATIGMIRFFYLYGHIGWMIVGSFILMTMGIRGFNRAALSRTQRLAEEMREEESERQRLIESTHWGGGWHFFKIDWF